MYSNMPSYLIAFLFTLLVLIASFDTRWMVFEGCLQSRKTEKIYMSNFYEKVIK